MSHIDSFHVVCRESIMFAAIGGFLNRTWIAVLAFWIILAVALHAAGPDWGSIAQDGEFSFLPSDSPSRRADKLFQQAFPHDLLASSIVIVVSRERGQVLGDDDKQFITDVLKPPLEKISNGDNRLPQKDAKENETAKTGN